MSKIQNITFIIVSSVLLLIFTAAICPVTLQNDTFYTIKIGEYIMQNGISVLHNGIDPFSWHNNLPYTYPHWLYDVLIYNIYNIGGFAGIYISTIVLACILALSIYYVNAKLTKNKLTSFIITLGVMYLIKGYIAARAQLLTFILFIWTVYFIEKFLKTGKKRYAISLIIIPIIIANCHSAVWPFFFILFLPYIGEYLVSFIPDLGIYFRNWRIKHLTKKLNKNKIKENKVEFVNKKIESYIAKNEKNQRINEKRRENPYKIKIERNKNTKFLIAIALICSLTGLLTPLGDTPYTYLIHTVQGNTMKSISEHLPMTLIESKDFLCVIALFLAILIFTDRKIKLSDLFFIGGLLYLTLSSRRQMSMFVLICSIVFNRLVCSLFDKYDPNGCKKAELQMIKLPGIIVTIAVVLIMSLYFVKPKMDDKFINTAGYPVKAADYILENLDLSTMRLFNEYNYGSYLIYRGIPVFIDSRADLYAPEFNGGKNIFSDFINTSSISAYYEDKFEKYKITHVIVGKKTKLNMLISRNSDYKLLYSDDNFCLYDRLKRN